MDTFTVSWNENNLKRSVNVNKDTLAAKLEYSEQL